MVNDDMADQSRADGFRDIGGVGVVPTGVSSVVFCFAAGAVALPVVPTIGPIGGRTRSVSSFGHRRRVLATASPAWTSVVSAPDARQSGTVPRYVPADGHRGEPLASPPRAQWPSTTLTETTVTPNMVVIPAKRHALSR